MNIHEAIKTLKANYPDACYEQLREAVDVAISALQAQDVPDMNVGDMVSRKAAIDALRVAYWDDNIQSAKDDPCIVDAMTDWAIRQVKALPSTQPERKNGKWVRCDTDGFRIMRKCSECGARIDIQEEFRSIFCYHCGADMRGEQDG